jgi:hypothetical protein
VGGFLVVLVVLAIIGLFVWQFIESRQALATSSMLTRYTPEQAAQLIHSAFGGARSVLWTNTKGRGTINKRRRGWKGGVTMSIEIEPLPDGGCRIDMWASQYVEYLPFFVNMAGVVTRRKRAIAKLLAEPDTQQLVATNGGTSVQPARHPEQAEPADWTPSQYR